MNTTTNHTATEKATYFFEVYTDNGKDIKVGYVLNCGSKAEAKERIQQFYGSQFSEFIQCYESFVSELGCPTQIIGTSFAEPAAPVAEVPADLTPASLETFLMYANDAGNWSGYPWVMGNVRPSKAQRGNLTDLQKKNYILIENNDGKYIVFLEKGKALAAAHGIELT